MVTWIRRIVCVRGEKYNFANTLAQSRVEKARARARRWWWWLWGDWSARAHAMRHHKPAASFNLLSLRCAWLCVFIKLPFLPLQHPRTHHKAHTRRPTSLNRFFHSLPLTPLHFSLSKLTTKQCTKRFYGWFVCESWSGLGWPRLKFGLTLVCMIGRASHAYLHAPAELSWLGWFYWRAWFRALGLIISITNSLCNWSWRPSRVECAPDLKYAANLK